MVIPFLGFLALEDGTDRLSQNVGKELPTHATLTFRRRAPYI